ncbi:hypothetical protein ACU635_25100 [[Actinomadura] parvosata]|uniref:hypothetical protein n=1 Tax=[Actinomadura] parvosata TaxID=1955412 RepID=UPI00406C7067
MSEAWDDDELLSRLRAAMTAAEAVPREIVEAGRLTIELEITDSSLLGQVVPPGAGKVRTGLDVSTSWFTL